MRILVWVGGTVLCVVLLAVLLLSAFSMRTDAGRVQATIDIASTPELIWPWLTEGEKAKKWVSWLVEVREVSKDKEIWVMEDRNNGGQRMEIEGTVKAQDFPRSITVHIASPANQFEGDQTYTLTALTDATTRVTVDGKFSFGQGIARLMEPIITPSASQKLQSDLRTLQKAIEQPAKP